MSSTAELAWSIATQPDNAIKICTILMLLVVVLLVMNGAVHAEVKTVVGTIVCIALMYLREELKWRTRCREEWMESLISGGG